MNLTFNDRLQKPTAEMNPASWVVRLQDVYFYCIPVASIFVGAKGIRETFSFHFSFLI
jgi:hypothetical protein